MREEFKRLKIWVEKCPIEAAIRIEELEQKNESLKQQLDSKIALINNGWEEERFILQDRVERYENSINLAIAHLEESESIPLALDALKEVIE